MNAKAARRLPVIACVLAYLVVGALYLDAVPPWEAPDEPWHMAYAEAVASGRQPTDAETYEAHQPPLYYGWVALGLRALGVDEVPRAPDNPWYPYAQAALWHEPGDPGAPLLAVVRAFSALLGCLVIVLAWAATRAAVGGRAAPVLAALIVGLTPQFVFISHAVTNDTLATVVGALLTYGLMVWVARTGSSGRVAVVLAVGGAAAVLTKLNAVAVLLAAVPAAALVGWRDRSAELPAMARMGRVAGPVVALVAGAAAATAALALLAPDTAGAIAAQAATRGLSVDPAAARFEVAARLLVGTLVSLWARFGWLSVDLPLPLTASAAVAAALGLVGAVAAGIGGDGRLRRALFVAAAIVSVALVAAARSSLVDPQPQGRLLLPALAALALLLAVGWTALLPRRWHMVLVAVAAAFLVGANLVATTRSIPQAMEASQGPMPPVDLRLMPSSRVVAADLAQGHDSARQTFEVIGPGLRRVEVPVAGASGDGSLLLRLLQDDGTVAGEARLPLSGLRGNSWAGLDVGPLRDSAGRSYTLVLQLDAATPEARVRFWGASSDVYPAGELVTEEHGATGTDLIILTLLDDRAGR